MRAGAPEQLASTASLADGLLTLSVGSMTFPLIKPVIHDVVTVTDDDITLAMRFLHREAGLELPHHVVAEQALQQHPGEHQRRDDRDQRRGQQPQAQRPGAAGERHVGAASR